MTEKKEPEFLNELRAIEQQVALVEEAGKMMAPVFDIALRLYGAEITAGAAMSYVADVMRKHHDANPDPEWRFLEVSIETFRRTVKTGESSVEIISRPAK